jgi:hypothetical protein
MDTIILLCTVLLVIYCMWWIIKNIAKPIPMSRLDGLESELEDINIELEELREEYMDLVTDVADVEDDIAYWQAERERVKKLLEEARLNDHAD